MIYLQCSAWIWREGWCLQQEILPETGVCCVVWDVLWVRACWDSQIGESQVRTGLGLKWAAGSEQSWVWAARLVWHHLDTHKFWMCERLHRNSGDVLLSLAPKHCPDFILGAFRILSWLKNEVCIAMLPCGRQPAPALLLLCACGCVGWMGHRKYWVLLHLSLSDLCVQGSIPASSLLLDSHWLTGIEPGPFLFHPKCLLM